MHVKLLIGLPGSGKSYYGRNSFDLKTVFLDDFTQTDDLEHLARVLSDPELETVIISDFAFLISYNVETAVKFIKAHAPDATISYIAWESAPDKCWANVLRRNDGRFIKKHYLFAMAKRYDPYRFTDAPLAVFQP